MANKYLLKYRTWDELLADASMDLKKYAVNGLIDPAPLIKIAMLINKKLGNKLRPVKEAVLHVEKGRVRLPADFHLLQHGFMCYGYTVTNKVIAGDQREYRCVEEVVEEDECAVKVVPTLSCAQLIQCPEPQTIIETIEVMPNSITGEEFTGSESSELTLSQNYTPGTIKLYKNGVRINDFTEVGVNTITLNIERLVDDVFLVDFNY